MVQVSKHKWCLETKDGKVIVDELVLSSEQEAKEYAERYLSSFIGWSFEVVILQEDI